MVTGLESRKRINNLLNVRKEIGDCQRCQLSQERANIVFGEGNPFSELMIIGEGPGEREDSLARPFVGRSGELLDEVLRDNDITRDDVYITNIVKCRPPGNRNPNLDEMNTCEPFLYNQIKAIAPRCVVTLGKVAAERLLKRNVKITQERGRALSCSDFPHIFLVPTLHPSYILRNGGKGKDNLMADIGYGLDLISFGVTPTQMQEEVYKMWMEQNQVDFEKGKNEHTDTSTHEKGP